MSHVHEFRVGAARSGSDAPVMVLSRLKEYWMYRYGFEFGFRHAFSVECEQHLRRWILDTCNPDFLFEDVSGLANSRIWDVKTQAMVELPTVDLFGFGFECDSISSLNRGRRLGSVQEQSGRSGTTADMRSEYVSTKRPYASSWRTS